MCVNADDCCYYDVYIPKCKLVLKNLCKTAKSGARLECFEKGPNSVTVGNSRRIMTCRWNCVVEVESLCSNHKMWNNKKTCIIEGIKFAKQFFPRCIDPQ